jgi:hypothetical protein
VTDASWRGIYDDVIEGWLTFAEQLRFTLERHPGAERRTLYLNGRAGSEGAALPAEAIGLVSLTPVPVGERYALTAPTGESMAGTIWYRAAYQVGLTVDGYGDGLIIVGTRPKTAASAYGGGSLVITTYGMKDDAFAAFRDRWSRWWRGRYDVIEVVHA